MVITYPDIDTRYQITAILDRYGYMVARIKDVPRTTHPSLTTPYAPQMIVPGDVPEQAIAEISHLPGVTIS